MSRDPIKPNQSNKAVIELDGERRSFLLPRLQYSDHVLVLLHNNVAFPGLVLSAGLARLQLLSRPGLVLGTCQELPVVVQCIPACLVLSHR